MPDYGTLNAMAKLLEDAESTRIAAENRLRDITQSGLGTTAETTVLASVVDQFNASEHALTLAIQRAMKQHPLGAWVAATPGLGLKQTARLLGTIGDPYIKAAIVDRDTGEIIEDERPRTPGELWQYCGYGAPSQKRRGERVFWNPDAKMRVFLIAESCIKQVGSGNAPRSPYRDVYEAGRHKYEDATHAEDCKRCGPAGHPALAGSELSDGHKHARAMRLVCKAILLDLWREAERLAEATAFTTPTPATPRHQIAETA